MSITLKHFGTLPNGQEISMFTLTNKNGLKAEVLNYGGILVSLNVPDKKGKMADIVLGYDKLDDYLSKSPYFGAIIGRHANRIEKGRFTLNGREYQLKNNEGNNHLHGGTGFDKRVWETRIISNYDNKDLELSLFSPDGDEHYPGNLQARVIYKLTDSNTLEIEYFGISDRDTVLNMTHHSYFNLAGHDAGTVLDHQLKINADFYTPLDKELLPTGEILKVKNTPFDFTQFRAIGDGLINNSSNEQLIFGNGYDHNFVLNRISKNQLEEACTVYEPQSGRLMKVHTTKPGLQFFSGNNLKNVGPGKNKTEYDKWYGFCLETQYFPNSLKYGHFTSPILAAGENYHHKTVYQFSNI